MTNLLTLDPGMSTGITLGWFDDDEPYQRLAFWQVEGGLPGLMEWLAEYPLTVAQSKVVCEKFVPLPTPRSFKMNELEPIRIEGALAMFLADITWQRASQMVLAGGDTPAQRKKNSDNILKEMGLWVTGKAVGMKDANDVISAQKHAIAYLRSIDHGPTMRVLAMGEEHE